MIQLEKPIIWMPIPGGFEEEYPSTIMVVNLTLNGSIDSTVVSGAEYSICVIG